MSPAIRHQIERMSNRIALLAKFDEDVRYERTLELSNMLAEKFDELSIDRSDRDAEQDMIYWLGPETQVAADLKDPFWIRFLFYKAHSGTRLGLIFLTPILCNFIYAFVLGIPQGRFSWGMTSIGMMWMPLLVAMVVLARIQVGNGTKSLAKLFVFLCCFAFYIFNDAREFGSRVLMVGTFENWGIAFVSVAVMQGASLFRCVAWLLLFLECAIPNRQMLLQHLKRSSGGHFNLGRQQIRELIGA
jgi:hypothetical protein